MRNLVLIIKILSIGLILCFCLTGFVYGQNQKPAFNEIYNTTRIEAYKRFIKFYNSSVADTTAERIAKAIIYYSYKHGIEDDRFVAAVITIESMFNPYAVSRAGAMGLGQLMPGTASDLAVRNPYSIEENIDGSCRYLKQQLDRFRHHPRQTQYELTLAAYNAGPGAVQRWGGIPPYAETKAYVVDVINVWRQISGLRPMTGSELAQLRRRAETVRKQQQAKQEPPKPPVKMEIKRTYKTVIIDESGLDLER
jgi:hypothetical protein